MKLAHLTVESCSLHDSVLWPPKVVMPPDAVPALAAVILPTFHVSSPPCGQDPVPQSPLSHLIPTWTSHRSQKTPSWTSGAWKSGITN